ncbi:MAG: hypothetical protein K1X95_05595 [Acidimicrobiia bacterium]|nr:hypothetical protein [Acidimicrobiia bacterium]
MRYLSLSEALVIAEAVTGIDVPTLSLMLGVAAGEFDEAVVAEWLLRHVEPTAPDDQR